MLPSRFRQAMPARTLRPFASPPTRQFQTSSIRPFPKKGAEDKDSISTESTEYSKSGGDGSSATEQAAFDPSKTSPEAEHESARKESGGNQNNPLNASPANQDISATTKPQEGGAQGSPSETGSGSQKGASGGGSPNKSGGKHSG